MRVLFLFLVLAFVSHITLYSLTYQMVCRIPAGIKENQVLFQKLEGRYLQPRGVAYDGNYFYLGDVHKKRIYIADKNGNYVGDIKDEAFSEIEDLIYWQGYLWVKIFRNYFETMDLWKIDTATKKVVLKIASLDGFNKKAVDYIFKNGYIWMIGEDESCFQIDPEKGKILTYVPSPWFDDTGYYRLVRKSDGYTLLMWDKNKKFRSKFKLPSKVKFYRLVDADGKIWLDPVIYGIKKAYVYHYNLEGKVDQKEDRVKILEKSIDKPYMLRVPVDTTNYIDIVKIK